jgi:hypothetical protein
MRLIAHFVALLTAFALQAATQLLGCEDIGCPFDGAKAQCELGGTTATVLGISTLDSSGSQPLTWTVAISPRENIELPVQTWNKDFYLGQPPSFQLQSDAGATGCAIIFEGVSSSLQFTIPGVSTDRFASSGTCEDALGSHCVSAWITQAESELHRATQSGQSLNCAVFAETLQRSPPQECAVMYGNWGLTTAHGK